VWGERLWLRIVTSVSLLWSLVAVWSMTLAEQAFPSDALRNPFMEHVLPNWAVGNIARNLGTILGLQGVLSLAPLLLMVAAVAGIWWWMATRSPRHPLTAQTAPEQAMSR